MASRAAVELEIKVGPTTDLYFSDNEAALKTAIQFWQGFDQPSRYIALFYNFDDLGWAEEELMSSGLGLSQEGAKQMVQAPCTDTICTGANSGLGYGYFPFRWRERQPPSLKPAQLSTHPGLTMQGFNYSNGFY